MRKNKTGYHNHLNSDEVTELIRELALVCGDNLPPVIEGTVLLSAGELSGWPADSLNPYWGFQTLKPVESIDHGVFVYRGRFDLHRAAAEARADNAVVKLSEGNAAAALSLAQESVALDPTLITAQSALGDMLVAAGRKDEAHQAWQTALADARKLDTGAQSDVCAGSGGKAEAVRGSGIGKLQRGAREFILKLQTNSSERCLKRGNPFIALEDHSVAASKISAHAVG